MAGRVMNVLRDEKNVAEHMIVFKKGLGKCCYCSNNIKVMGRRTSYVPFRVPLSCSTCEKERLRWESWWKKVEDAERQAEEELRNS